MNVMPLTKAMKNLPYILKTLEDEDSTFTITRNGRAVGILMTPDRYDALLETIEILGDKEVMTALETSRTEFEKGDVFGHRGIFRS